MSLFEASAIVPGQSFLARDLVRGGEPVLISERTATRTLKEWDRIAARIVVQGEKRILAGGLLAFTFEGSERLMANLQDAAVQSPHSGWSAPSVKKPLITNDTLREMAPLFTATWLSDVLPKALGLSRPPFTIVTGTRWSSTRCGSPSASRTTLERTRRVSQSDLQLASRERGILELARSAGVLAAVKPQRYWRECLGLERDDGGRDDGARHHRDQGTLAYRQRQSAARAERAIAMLRAALGGLVAAPLTQIQTVEQMMTQQQTALRSTSELPPEIQARLVHATLDRQYRALLEQPIPMLGNVTPAPPRERSPDERSWPSG